MAHVVSAPCGMSSRRLAERHLRSKDDETTRQLQENLERNNSSKLSNGTTKMPALIVTPDGTRVSEQEETECERLSKDLDRLQRRLGQENYRKLVELTNTAGPEALSVVMAAERWVQKHKDSLSMGLGLTGGAASGAKSRLDEFGKSLAQYEDALNTYLLSKHSPAAQRAKAREAAQRAFKDLNGRFAGELETMAQSSRYKNWVHNPFRSFAGGVEASFNTSGSPISSLPETKRLNLGLGATRVLGKGTFALDLVSRGTRVMYSDNKDYQLAKEATSFAFSSGTAFVVARGAAFGLTLVLGSGGLVLVVSVAALTGLAAYLSDEMARNLFDDTADALLD
ncbi:hypothetical protein [Vreelandella utahensis]|uniref:hypothetical protein n=1 Tax=Vreelandella halophila TaxID=86177 RepID=UPI000984DF06|nr:hypothetical protein [Halomonas utahensis]